MKRDKIKGRKRKGKNGSISIEKRREIESMIGRM